ncbi:MAG: protein-glutamate O-methyltransferase CheR [Gammaproteobacteria bacterium]|nr:protein-glutamate O-methyltransferase CheR [Gammaproteobacteria bacterium]
MSVADPLRLFDRGCPQEVGMSDLEFNRFRRLGYELMGIDFSPHKQSLLCGRLAKRLRAFGFSSYSQYLDWVQCPEHRDEMERMIDLLTTHETYFFREPAHFKFLAEQLLPDWPSSRPLRVWSAASSTGEEAYSLAMVLMDRLGEHCPWQIFASDISREVLAKARNGIYSMERTDGISPDYLKRYCLRGVGPSAGTLRIDGPLRRRVDFAVVNLNESLTALPEFDVVFLRNVLIYFDVEAKRRIVERIVGQLRPGGWLFIGHSESLHGLHDGLRLHRPTVYRRLPL